MITSTPTQYGYLEDTFSVRGMSVERYIDAERGTEVWRPLVQHPFRQDDLKLRVSLNDKLLALAYEKGITGIVIGGRVMPKEMYSPASLRKKVKAGEYETKESYFGKENDYKLYYFEIG